MPIGLRSRKHIQPFDRLQPQRSQDSCVGMAPHRRAALKAGGPDLIDRTKNEEASDSLIVLEGIAAGKGIRRADEKIEPEILRSTPGMLASASGDR
jgi:aerobic carbon-monoxide dehydrogenase medium subunit